GGRRAWTCLLSDRRGGQPASRAEVRGARSTPPPEFDRATAPAQTGTPQRLTRLPSPVTARGPALLWTWSPATEAPAGRRSSAAQPALRRSLQGMLRTPEVVARKRGLASRPGDRSSRTR